MWKLAIAFAVFAGVALFMISRGGEVDMGGEKHGIEAPQGSEAAASAASAS